MTSLPALLPPFREDHEGEGNRNGDQAIEIFKACVDEINHGALA